MSSGCGDVLSLADLQTAKKHQLFEAEVITGKQGGVAGGADIDYATNPVTLQTQKTLPAILRDVGFDPASFDFSTGGTLGVNDRDKVVYDPVSKTWYSYGGTLPVTVPAGFNPVGNANWTPQTDPNLRAELASSTGTTLIGRGGGTLESSLVSIEGDIEALETTVGGLTSTGVFSRYETSLHGAGKSLGAKNSLITATLLSSRNKVIDIDISTTQDNVAICFHNATIDGVLSGSGNVFDLTFNDIRTNYRVLAFDGTPYQGVRVTSWDEMVKACARRSNLITAELKNTQGNSTAMNGIRNSIANYKMLGRVSLQCLNYSRLIDYRTLTGDTVTPLLLLIYDGMPNEDLVAVINLVRAVPGMGINIDMTYSRLTEAVSLAQQYSLFFSFWTATTKTQELNGRLAAGGVQISCDYSE